VYPPAPPAGVTSAVPSLIPQSAAVDEFVAVIAVGSEIAPVAVAVQLLSSVTVTVGAPGQRPSARAVVAKPPSASHK